MYNKTTSGMTFIQALSKLNNYGRKMIGTDKFCCITSDTMIRKNEVYIIDCYGLRKLNVDFENYDYKYTNEDTIRTECFNNNTWHYFTTWKDLGDYYNALA